METTLNNLESNLKFPSLLILKIYLLDLGRCVEDTRPTSTIIRLTFQEHEQNAKKNPCNKFKGSIFILSNYLYLLRK